VLAEDLSGWLYKAVVLSLGDGERTTAQLLYVDRTGEAVCVDVLASGLDGLGRKHRIRTIPFRQIVSVCAAPADESRRLPLPDPCYAYYGAFDRFLVFLPLILLIVPGSLLLFIVLDSVHYGTQLSSLIIYTAAIVLWTFSAYRGQQRYLFTCAIVAAELPLFCIWHFGFLLVLFVVETAALEVRPLLSVC
jgi:hypothetical protein